MCKCLNCPNGELSFSRCNSEIEACEVPSYKIKCKLLKKVVLNVPDPRAAKVPVPADCPLKDEDEKKLSFIDKLSRV